MLLTILKTYWKEIIIVLVIAAAVWYMRSLYSTIDNQKNQIVQLTTANTILKENEVKLENAIKANNAAIEKLAEAAADTNKAFTTLNGNVKQQTNSLASKLSQILNEKKPQTCEATIQYLIDAVKELK